MEDYSEQIEVDSFKIGLPNRSILNQPQIMDKNQNDGIKGWWKSEPSKARRTMNTIFKWGDLKYPEQDWGLIVFQVAEENGGGPSKRITIMRWSYHKEHGHKKDNFKALNSHLKELDREESKRSHWVPSKAKQCLRLQGDGTWFCGHSWVINP